MAKLQKTELGDVQVSGSMRNIPGLDGTDQQMADKLPIFVSSEVLTLHTAQTNKNAFVAPCDMTIVGCVSNLVEAPGTAAGAIIVGKRGDADAFSTGISFATTDSAGEITEEDVATVFDGADGVDVSQGDVIEFSTDGGATTTGLAAVQLVCLPK